MRRFGWWAVLGLALGAGCDDGDDGGNTPADASGPAADGAAPGQDMGAAADAAPGDAAVQADAGDPAVGQLAIALAAARGVERARLEASIDFLGQPRATNTAHWQAVQDRCATVFEEAGLTVERHAYGTGTNVIGVKRGTTRPDEYVLIGAHYDSVPNCPGADDNASGVAGVFEAARILGPVDHARSLMLACWDEEERGLIGAEHFVARALTEGTAIVAHFNLESVGHYDTTPGSQTLPEGFEFVFPAEIGALNDRGSPGDFLALIGDAELNPGATADVVTLAEALELEVVALPVVAELRTLGPIRRSDHAPFWDAGYPSIFMTATAEYRNQHYHCYGGTDDAVDFPFLTKVVGATVGAALLQLDVRTDVPPAPMGTVIPPPAPTCDLTAGLCDGGHCVLAAGDDGWTGARCLPAVPDATGAEGELCTRPDGLVGLDTCAEGLICAFWGQPAGEPQPRTCHSYCREGSDCGQDEVCVAIGNAGHGGGCAPGCDPLDADACGEGLVCSRVGSWLPLGVGYICNFGGDKGRGEACVSFDCAAGLDCKNVNGVGAQCLPRCRPSEGGCPPDSRCVEDVAEGAPDDFGHCYPSR